MEHAGKLIIRLVLLVASLLTLRVIVWFFEQREHGKEYWIIFAHVIPFLLAIIAGAGVSIFVLKWVLRRLGRDD